ncbi:MAG: hypothetical protein M3177_02725 [Pseudomonadota bacterium]|nr:hypothetical protein [Pseudomonadota bacterium]
MSDEVDRLLEVWKTTVDVQKHFNDLEMRVRSIAITVLAAFLAAAGYTLKEGLRLHIFGQDVPLTVFLLLAATICWLSFYLMDRLWYHRLLRGAVDHGLKVEQALEKHIPEIGLTRSIGDASPFFIKGKKVSSNEKMDWFYGSIVVLLLLGAAASLLNQPEQPRAGAPQSIRLAYVVVCSALGLDVGARAGAPHRSS